MTITVSQSYISQNFQNQARGQAWIDDNRSVWPQNSGNVDSDDHNIQKVTKGTDDFPGTRNNTNPSDNSTEQKIPENKKNTANKGKTAANRSSKNSGLTEKELRIIKELKAIDTKVRRHEMAHIAAGGQYITSGAHYQYQKGPDGNNYAVAGDVHIDTSPVPGDPEATIAKMRKVREAALAPADPSPQDKKVAAESSFIAAKALSELMRMQAEQRAETIKQQFQSGQNTESRSKRNHATAADAYKNTVAGHNITGKAIDIAA